MATGLLTPLVVVTDLNDASYDGVLVISDGVGSLCAEPFAVLASAIKAQAQVDGGYQGNVSVIGCDKVSGKRIIFSPTGSLTGDFDDVRAFQDAAVAGIKRSLSAGCQSILIVLAGGDGFSSRYEVTILGALQALYVPIEVREADSNRAKKMTKLGIYADSNQEMNSLLPVVQAIESGRIVYRDIGGSDPERMAAPKVANYVQEMFSGTCVKVEVMSDDAVFQKEYPMLAAVNRCARHVDRHQARLIHLSYEGEGPIEKTLLLVGKGITYDTGGADLKAGGIMAGMHRDKCGAAFVAGFFQFLSVNKPKGLKVIGAMAMVRNSIGSDCYVADEIITSRAGVRVRIGNTDAEGRMVMCDVLCYMKEKALKEINPHIFTIATLTGHVIRCYGPNYTAAVDNGPAWKDGTSKTLVDVGDMVADPFEISRLRREDFKFCAGPSEYEDVLQSNNLPSSMTSRGHQYPAAFLMVASGLDKYGLDSAKPLPYTHMDIAGSSGPFPGVPTGSPIPAMAHMYALKK